MEEITTKILVVEDSDIHQKVYASNLERIVGKNNFIITDNDQDARYLISTSTYDWYILDGKFKKLPNDPIDKTEELGIELANEIKEKEGSYGKIRIVSDWRPICTEATRLGITNYPKTDMNKLFEEISRTVNSAKLNTLQ